MTMGAAAYADQLGQLLPRGRAWARGADTVLGRLLGGMSAEFARVDARAAVLVDEADPRTALELLPDWERVAGLPDNCTGASGTITERRIALASKLTQLGGQSVPVLVELAATLGYFIEIDELTSCDAGFAAGAELFDDGWRFSWQVEVVLDETAYRDNYAEFVVGSEAGDPLRSYGALDLECLFDRVKPAHTSVVYVYSVEPDPVFWFDFTAEG